jgi:hypothetical protein
MDMSSRRLLSVLLLYACSLAVLQGADRITDLKTLELPTVEKEPWRFEGFPILAWWPPPGTATIKDFRVYKEAGFTIYPANPDCGFENSIMLAEQAGLPVVAWRSYQGFSLPKPEHPIAFRDDNPNIVGWVTGDEPSGMRNVVKAITAVNKLMREDPSRAAFFNMLPPRRQGRPDTKAIIDAGIRCGMPVLSYDDYVMYDDGRNETKEHFDALEVFRQASVQHDVPFWAFALTSGHDRYRPPSESDLRWKQYTNLAYGAKGLWYFCYWGPTNRRFWDKNGIVNPRNGRKTKLYRYVKTLNHAVLAMGDILLGLTNEGVVHTNPPKGHRPFRPGEYWISDIAAGDALIGFFHDADGTPYAMVVNKQHGMNKSVEETADTIELTFAPDVRSVVAVNWLDGIPGPIAMKERKASLRLYGGTGVLLKAEVTR